MASVDLKNLDLVALDMLLRSSADYARHENIVLGEHAGTVADVARHARKILIESRADPKWWGYLAVEPGTRQVVGSCGFKGRPSPDGTVEIAFCTFAGFENHGHAKGMVKALAGIASASPDVRRVIAHTLPEKNAAAAVLEHAKFKCAGEDTDPVDGMVWRWEWVVRCICNAIGRGVQIVRIEDPDSKFSKVADLDSDPKLLLEARAVWACLECGQLFAWMRLMEKDREEFLVRGESPFWLAWDWKALSETAGKCAQHMGSGTRYIL
jgi:ribosomal-protein-alanine N-acetyltransferase